MTKICLVILLFVTFPSLSHENFFELSDPCSQKIILKEPINSKYINYSIGKLSLDYLNYFQIPFVGEEYGIHQILETPVGEKSLVILSDKDMLSFGWCYSINNVVYNSYPHQIMYQENMKSIHWFYGYAEFKNGKWISMCKKALKLPKKLNPSCLLKKPKTSEMDSSK